MSLTFYHLALLRARRWVKPGLHLPWPPKCTRSGTILVNKYCFYFCAENNRIRLKSKIFLSRCLFAVTNQGKCTYLVVPKVLIKYHFTDSKILFYVSWTTSFINVFWEDKKKFSLFFRKKTNREIFLSTWWDSLYIIL